MSIKHLIHEPMYIHSTSFISKQEGQKTIIEGSGSVKVKDEEKSANFKYIRTILTEGNEKGVEVSINKVSEMKARF